MNLRTVLGSVAGLILLSGAAAVADPTYSIYSNPQVGEGGTLTYGLNDFGSYVGWSYSSGTYFGFLTTSDGKTTAIGPLGASETHATGVNDNNVVVGYFTDGSGVHGFMDTGGTYTTLNAPGVLKTYVYGVNNKGQVVGYYVDKSGVTHGFIESGGVFTTIDVTGAVATYGLSINENGDVVGSFFDGSKVHGFIYHNGTFESVDYEGDDATWLTGINQGGMIVGWGWSSVMFGVSPFVRDATGQFTFPFYAGSPGSQYTGINDLGQKTGFGDLLLTRINSFPNVVASAPEPGTATLLGAGALLLMIARRFRRKQ